MALFDSWRTSTHEEVGHPAPALTMQSDIERYLRGAVRLVRTVDGLIQPYRFSARQMEMLEHIGRAERARATSGIVIDFITDGNAVSFDCQVTRGLDRQHGTYQAVMQHEGVLGRPEEGVIDGIDVVAGGLRSYTTAVRDGIVDLTFDNPDHDRVEVRIYLPYVMSVAVGNLASNGSIEPAPERGYLLALGDSITQGFVVGCPSLTYPSLVASALGLDVVNQGIAGHIFDRRTLRGMEDLHNRPPVAITVAYGTNDWTKRDSPRAIQRAAERYLSRLLRTFPNVPIYVISPLWRADEHERVPAGVPLTWVGDMLEGLCRQRRSLTFVDGYHAIPKNSVMLADGRLHPGSVDAGLLADTLIAQLTADGVAGRAEGAAHLSPYVETIYGQPESEVARLLGDGGAVSHDQAHALGAAERTKLLASVPLVDAGDTGVPDASSTAAEAQASGTGAQARQTDEAMSATRDSVASVAAGVTTEELSPDADAEAAGPPTPAQDADGMTGEESAEVQELPAAVGGDEAPGGSDDADSRHGAGDTGESPDAAAPRAGEDGHHGQDGSRDAAPGEGDAAAPTVEQPTPDLPEPVAAERSDPQGGMAQAGEPVPVGVASPDESTPASDVPGVPGDLSSTDHAIDLGTVDDARQPDGPDEVPAPQAERLPEPVPESGDATDGATAEDAGHVEPAWADLPEGSVSSAQDEQVDQLGEAARQSIERSSLPTPLRHIVRTGIAVVREGLARGSIAVEDALVAVASYAARMAAVAGADGNQLALVADVAAEALIVQMPELIGIDEDDAALVAAGDAEAAGVDAQADMAGASDGFGMLSGGDIPAEVSETTIGTMADAGSTIDDDEDWDDLDDSDDWGFDEGMTLFADPLDDSDDPDDPDDDDDDWLSMRALAAAMDLYESAVDPSGDMVGTPIALLDADAENRARGGAPSSHGEFDRLVRTIWRLRQPDGCPWDLEQTHESIMGNMVEEAYEAVEAIQSGDVAHICEELGDVLEQVLLHSQIAADQGEFTIDDVCRELNKKLIRRHPHVFGDEVAETAEDALRIWKEVKLVEREMTGDDEMPRGVLDSIPRTLPALMQCQKISNRVARLGFDWDSVEQVWEKVSEESAEFVREPRGSDEALLEFGDLLFSLVNVARFEGIDASKALQASNDKFRRRWALLERLAMEGGRDPSTLSPEEFDLLWEHAKSEENLGALLRSHHP